MVFQLQICWLLWLIAMKDLRVTFFAWKIIVAILWLSASVVSPIYKKGEKLTQIHFLDSPAVLSLCWRPWDFFDLYFPVSSDPELWMVYIVNDDLGPCVKCSRNVLLNISFLTLDKKSLTVLIMPFDRTFFLRFLRDVSILDFDSIYSRHLVKVVCS